MTLDYNTVGIVQVQMFDYVTKLLHELPSDMDGTVNTPAAYHLFLINPQPTLLDEEMASLFHHLVAELLFLSKYTCPDIQMAVVFLTTRVQAPDTDDYKKLNWVMHYLHGTENYH